MTGFFNATSSFSLVAIQALKIEADNNYIVTQPNPNAFYVDSNIGNDNGNDGLTEQTPFLTIQRGIDAASAGYTVYVKAGTYSAGINLAWNGVEGTLGNPITVQGYQFVPEDIPTLDWLYPANTGLDAAVMPLINGGNRAVGTCLTLGSDGGYIVVKNMQITGYDMGASIYNSPNCTLENVTMEAIGDVNGGGNGIKINRNSHFTTLNDCIVYNATTNGILMYSSDNVVDNCTVISDDTTSGTHAYTDYYFGVRGNDGLGGVSSDRNTFTNCYAERAGAITHSAHTFGVKDGGTENLFDGCVAKNVIHAFQARYNNVFGNTWQNCTATADGTNGHNRTGGIAIEEGAHDNIFDNITVTNTSHAVWYHEGLEDEPSIGYTSLNNIIKNCNFSNMGTYTTEVDPAFIFAERDAGYDDVIVNSSLYQNCTFNIGPSLYGAYIGGNPTVGQGSDNVFDACDFTDIPAEFVNTPDNWGSCYNANCTTTNSWGALSPTCFPADETLSPTTYVSYSKPAYLVPYNDVYGYPVTKLTDVTTMGESANTTIRTPYPKKSAWNCDDTYIVFESAGGGTMYLVNGTDYSFDRTRTYPFSDVRWSNTIASRMYGISSNRYFSYFNATIVPNGAAVQLHDFGTDYTTLTIGFNEGNISDDDKYVVLTGLKADTTIDVIVYDIELDSVISTVNYSNTNDLDWATISRSGEYVVMLWRTKGTAQYQGVEVYNRAQTYQRNIFNFEGHGACIYDENGLECFVQYSSDSDIHGRGIISSPLDGTTGYNVMAGTWVDVHVNGMSNRQGYIYLGTTTANYEQVFALKVNNALQTTNTVNMFTQHHRQDGNSPRVTASRFGNRVLFSSDWGSTEISGYLVNGSI